MNSLHYFKGRRIVVATKHAKEKVIAPRLTNAFKLDCFVSDQIDTDLLGTFTGEVERVLSAYESAKRKCNWAMDVTQANLAIASEGSFGPHPSFPFMAAHEEMLLLIDRKNNWEFLVKSLATDTNFYSATVESMEQLEPFLQRALFPTHALIVKKSVHDATHCCKGIQTLDLLHETVRHFIDKYGSCQVETDMRAMHNPTRMHLIGELTDRLIYQMRQTCPACSTPGFRMTAIERGLPCILCGSPTRSVAVEIFSCQNCSHTDRRKRPDAPEKEDPMYCDFCNP